MEPLGGRTDFTGNLKEQQKARGYFIILIVINHYFQLLELL